MFMSSDHESMALGVMRKQGSGKESVTVRGANTQSVERQVEAQYTLQRHWLLNGPCDLKKVADSCTTQPLCPM